MSSAPLSFQDRNFSIFRQNVHLDNPEHLLESQSREKRAIAASIDELDESTYQSPSQQSAVETLRDFENSKVLELLSIIRLPGRVHYPYCDGLSSAQIDALSCLKHCPDSHILLWLRHSRVARSQSRNPLLSSLPTPQSAVTSGSKNPLRRPLKTKLRPPSTFPGHVPVKNGHITHNTTRNSFGQRRLLNNTPRQVSTQESCQSRVIGIQWRWCVNMFCDRHHERHVYTTCDGWKRHMKEHETVWPCMPYGSLKSTATGPICVLCGSMKPSQSHMAGHSIGGCGDTSTKLHGVSRRVNLERHLMRSHAVPDERTRGLADEWKITLRKKHFACGFCVCILSTIHDQLNHIDMDHFKKGQHIAEWSATKVIRGLLLSPKVASWFQRIIVSDPYAIDRDLHWDWHMIEDLQRRLEIAEDAPETLALEAYGMLTFNLSRQNSGGQHLPTSLSGLKFVGPSKVAMAPFAPPAESLEENSEHQIDGLAEDSDHPWLSDEHDVAVSSSSCSRSNYELSVNQSDASDAQSGTHYQRFYFAPPKGIPTVNASSAPRSQPVHILVQTSSASGVSDLKSTSAYDSFGATTPGTLPSTRAADISREQLKIYQWPTHDTETNGTLTSDLDDLAESSSLEGDSFPFDTYDRGQLQLGASPDKPKQHYDIYPESEHAKRVVQHDRHHQVEPLTCDPKDLMKKT